MPVEDKDMVFKVKEIIDEKEVVFTKIKLNKKKDDHPELLKKTFLKCVKSALSEPDEVWPNYQDNKKRCYYKKYSIHSYAKVVVWVDNEPYSVVSAYETDKIKEKIYPELNSIL